MAHRRRRRSKKWLGRILILILIIVAIVVGYFVWDSYFKDKKPEEGGNNPKETTKVEDKKEEKIEKQEDEVVEKEKVKQYEGEDPNVANDLTGVVTYAGVAGSELIIRVNIDQYLAEGNCRLSLLQDGAVVYSDTAEIIDSASTATCAGFNIPTVNLGAGEMGIRIELEANDKRGVIAGEVEL